MTSNDIQTPATRSALIAAQNDRFRQSEVRSGIPGTHVHTQGIAALRLDRRLEVLMRVRDFEDFTQENDPYGEHDFGSFEMEGVGRIFFKIDYYDTDYRYGSDDPADLQKTRRVLTVMLAEEY